MERRTGLPTIEVPNNCVHRWLIETANGPRSWGICRKCSITRHFPNAIVPDYGDSILSGRRKAMRILRGMSLDVEPPNPLNLNKDSFVGQKI